MNDRFKELAEQANLHATLYFRKEQLRKFSELLVEECRNAVSDVYRNTPLELCGPLLTVDEEIANHFYGVTEDD